MTTKYINVPVARAAPTAINPVARAYDSLVWWFKGTKKDGTNFIEMQRGGEAPSWAVTGTGWTVSDTGTERWLMDRVYSRMSAGVKRTVKTFALQHPLALASLPDNVLGDCLIFGPITGSFAAGRLTLALDVVGDTAPNGYGAMAVRVLHGTDPTGIGAGDLAVSGSGQTSVYNLSDSPQVIEVDVAGVSSVAFTDEYLFIKVAWALWNQPVYLGEQYKQPGSDVLLAVGPSSFVRTPLFIPGTIYKSVPSAHAAPGAKGVRILLGVAVPVAAASPSTFTPAIEQGVSVPKAAAAPTAITPGIVTGTLVPVPVCYAAPTALTPTVELGVAVPVAGALATAVDATIEPGPAPVEVPLASASPEAKDVRIALEVSVAFAGASPTALDVVIEPGPAPIVVPTATASSQGIEPVIEPGPVDIPIPAIGASPVALDPVIAPGPAPIHVPPAHAAPGAKGPATCLGVRVRPAHAAPGAKQPGVRFTYPVVDIMKLRVGALAPQALAMRVAPSSALPDLTAVTSVQIEVFKPDQSEITWDASITSQSKTGLVLTHLFRAGDLDQPGAYEVKAILTTSDGTARTEPARQYVGPQWEI